MFRNLLLILFFALISVLLVGCSSYIEEPTTISNDNTNINIKSSVEKQRIMDSTNYNWEEEINKLTSSFVSEKEKIEEIRYYVEKQNPSRYSLEEFHLDLSELYVTEGYKTPQLSEYSMLIYIYKAYYNTYFFDDMESFQDFHGFAKGMYLYLGTYYTKGFNEQQEVYNDFENLMETSLFSILRKNMGYD